MIPEAMKDASDFEIYVWTHAGSRSFEYIKEQWDKTTEEIKQAYDDGFEKGWQYIPVSKLPIIPDPKPTARKTRLARLRERRNEALYQEFLSGNSVSHLARKYGLSLNHTYKIIRGIRRE